DLRAELDALADADDPLAALTALARRAGDEQEPTSALATPDISVAPEPDDPGFSLDLTDDDPLAAEAEPAPGASQADTEAGQPDWQGLEEELNAAFDSDTLSAIDAASD